MLPVKDPAVLIDSSDWISHQKFDDGAQIDSLTTQVNVFYHRKFKQSVNKPIHRQGSLIYFFKIILGALQKVLAV